MDKSQLAAVLDSTLPDYPKLSEAPRQPPPGIIYDDRPSLPSSLRMTAEDWAWVETERAKRYKDIDRSGSVFLVMNPLVWPRRYKMNSYGGWDMAIVQQPREYPAGGAGSGRGSKPGATRRERISASI